MIDAGALGFVDRGFVDLGFIGLGVMGEPMCASLARKSGRPVAAFDPDPAPLGRLACGGVRACASVAEVAARVSSRGLSGHVSGPLLDESAACRRV